MYPQPSRKVIQNGSAGAGSIGPPDDPMTPSRLFALASEHYRNQETIDKIKEQAGQVQSWLMKNEGTVDRFGNELTDGDPWFIDLEYTDDWMRLDLRRSLCRERLFGTALTRMLHLVAIKKLIPTQVISRKDALKAIPKATGFRPMAVHEELMGYRLSEKKQNTTISLQELGQRFNLAPATNPTKMRDGRCMRMAGLGLWSVRQDPHNHYAISIGAVGEVFHRQVFAPVWREFEPKISGKKE